MTARSDSRASARRMLSRKSPWSSASTMLIGLFARRWGRKGMAGPSGRAGAGPTGRSTPSHAAERRAAGLYAPLLGPFAVYRGRTRLQLGNSRSVVELGRCLIAHAGQPIPRDELIELLWPRSEPSQAVHRLHVAVSQLRAA